jgi:hypothetical protein
VVADRSARIFISYDLSNTLGLVTGPKQQQIDRLTALFGLDQQIIAAQGGTNRPLLTWSNLYAHLAKAQVDIQVAKAKAAAELEMIQAKAHAELAVNHEKERADAVLNVRKARVAARHARNKAESRAPDSDSAASTGVKPE